MWTPEEIRIIDEGRKKGLTLQNIADLVGKTPAAVRVYMYRHGYALKTKLACPLVERLIKIKFAEPTWFKPNREFYSKVKISQKRFTNLRLGYANPTEGEMKAIARVLNINNEDFISLFNSRQLDLFEQQQ